MNKMSKFLIFAIVLLFSITITFAKQEKGFGESEEHWASGPLVKKEDRRSVVSTEYGEISAVRVSDNINGSYLFHFFTLEPNALFLPVVLHADMVFYVHTGSGKLSWTEDDDLKSVDIRRGDVYRLQQGSVFFIQSNLETTESERRKLRIHALFANSNQDLHEPLTGPYSSIREMVLGFDRKVLQAAFTVPEEVIDELLSGARQPSIIHGVTKTKRNVWDLEGQFIRGILGSKSRNIFELNKKKKKGSTKLYNLFKEDKDFENCNGWSTTVTRKKLSALRDSNIGLFLVNLTIGSMMGPHWNPVATEIAVVLQGRGMIRVVCSDVSNRTSCRNMRFDVKEGDVFIVPRFHPMAQMAFNNDTFVFMGFSTSAKRNHPQYLAGQASVLRTLDRDVLAMSFNVTNTTLDQLLAPQSDSVILGCTSCAEEELRIMQEEIEKEREEARKREEEAARKREKEKKREEEEERKREEEAARKEEEERRKREEEEEAARRKEEEERQRKEEEERQRRKEEEAARREEEERPEEAAREAEERQRQKEEEAAKREEEERQREEEAAREAEERERREQEEEEAAKREEEEERQRQEEEEAARREEEERLRREEEEAAREREEEAEQREAEEQRREEEEEAGRRRQEEEEGRERPEEEEQQGRSEEEQAAEEERRREEEAAARQREEEERGGGREEGGETRLEHENHGSHEEWRRRIPKRRVTV